MPGASPGERGCPRGWLCSASIHLASAGLKAECFHKAKFQILVGFMNWGQFSSSATSTLILVGFFFQPERFCPGPSNLHGHLQEPKSLQQGKQKLKYPQRKCVSLPLMPTQSGSPCPSFCLSKAVCCWFRGCRRAARQLTLPVTCCPDPQAPSTPCMPHRTGFEFPSLLQVHELNGIKIVTYCSPLYFANSEIFREKIIAKVSNALKDFCLQPIPNSPCSLLPCQAEIIKPRIIMKDRHIHALFFRSLLSDFLILDLILEATPESWQVSSCELCQSRVSLLHVSSPCTCWHPVPLGLWLCGCHHDHLAPVWICCQTAPRATGWDSVGKTPYLRG